MDIAFVLFIGACLVAVYWQEHIKAPRERAAAQQRALWAKYDKEGLMPDGSVPSYLKDKET